MLSSVLNGKRQWCCRVIVLLGVLPLAGCIASAPSSSQPITITVSPSAQNYMPVGGTLQFTASVQGSNAGVTWSTGQSTTCNASGPNGGGLGSINSSTGLYTAPPKIPASPCSIIITATSNADSTVLQQVQALVQVQVSMNSYPATIPTGTSYQFSATVTGSSNSEAQDLYWQVSPSTQGLISNSGLYSAPPAATSGVTITAGSAFDTSSRPPTATANISITPVNISISPTSATVDAGNTQQFTATVTGVSNTNVLWYVAGALNGNGNVGTITTGASTAVATYQAPSGNGGSLTITAQSQADSSAEANAIVMVLPAPAVSVSPANASIPIGGTQQFTATESGVTNPTFTWSVAAASGCTAANIGSINSSSGLYTAPASTILPVSPCPIVITASVPGGDTGSAPANLHVAVTITPATDTIGQGANRQFSAVVTGTTNQSVEWSANGVGIFDPSPLSPGLYVAPQIQEGTTPPTANITATSSFDPAQSGSATMAVLETDPLGTISNVQTLPASECPADSNGGLANGTCYSMTVSCDGVADLTTYLKVNTPPAGTTPLGTVIFGTGSGGTGLYDSEWTYGYETVEMVSAANFNTVQVSFGGPPFTTTAVQPNGWLQGPGGVRRLACRYATVADWVYRNPQTINPNVTAANSAPMCATGNSGGSGALGYAAYEYGLAGDSATGLTPEFAMIEPTSGPPMTRLDQGCICGQQPTGPADACTGSTPTSMCYSLSEAAIIDPAYQTLTQSPAPDLCSTAVNGGPSDANLFLSDSIEYAPANAIPIPLAKTLTVNMLLGSLDTTSGVPQGTTWWTNVGGPRPTQACAYGASHELPDYESAAQQIATDITSMCEAP